MRTFLITIGILILIGACVEPIPVDDSNATSADPSSLETEAPADSTTDGSGTSGLRAGDIRMLDSTMHSISIEWDLDGDDDHDAISRVKLRELGTPGWTDLMPLLRIDSTYPIYLTQYGTPSEPDFDMFAGSIMFLSPGTEYELWIELEDPDGGSATRVRTVSTQAYPERSPICTRMVTPSTFSSAYGSAGAGDVLCLEDGNYGDVRADRGGSEGSYLALVAAEGASAQFDRVRVETDYLWIEGMTFNTPQAYGTVRSTGPSEHVVLIRNTFNGSPYSVHMTSDTNYWYVVDNTISGNDPAIGEIEGEAIEMQGSSGHTVAFNTIRKTADAVSYGHRNIDVFGNDVYRMTDDGIEADKGYANKRYWGNRIVDSYNYAISLQPMYVGPYYFLYNEIRQTEWTRQGRSYSSQGGTMFKFNGYVDRFVLLHNTFVHEGRSPLAQQKMKMMLSTHSRNNLYVVESAPVWQYLDWGDSNAIPSASFYDNDWRTDMDYDAFAWTGSPGFDWDRSSYDTVESYADAIGIEANAVRFSTSDFETYPSDLRPRASTPITDSGALVPGMNDAYVGSAPDRGAYEYGADPMPVGAGTEATRRERHAYWER